MGVLSDKQVSDLNRMNVSAHNSALGAVIQFLLGKNEDPTITIVTGTKAGAGDNELIAAVADKQIVIAYFVIQNESANATTMILKDGATNKVRYLAQNQGDGFGITYPADARWKLTKATALNLNLSGANSCGYTIGYYTV